MSWPIRRKPLKVFARGTSLRRRVAYSLAVVRLILVPVIFLAVYYLFAVWWIVDEIVRVDAPVAMYAERVSIDMLDARRGERNYFLFYDPADLDANRQAVARLDQLISTCRSLQPEERPALEMMHANVQLYQKSLAEAVARQKEVPETPASRVRDVVRAYTRDLNDLLKHASRQSRAQLIDELHNRLGSLDAQVAATLEAEDPAFRQITADLRTSSSEVERLASELQKRSWERVQRDHDRARALVYRAEWVLGVVSALTLLLSVWVSFVLPRTVVKPLVDLKAAVDHAVAGNYEIEFDVEGEGEVIQLANSVRKLIAHIREKKNQGG